MRDQIQWAMLVLCLGATLGCSAPSNISDAANSQNETNQKLTHIYTEQFEALQKSKDLTRDFNQAALDRQKQMEQATR